MSHLMAIHSRVVQLPPQLQISYLASENQSNTALPLVLLHAFPLSSEMWREQIELFGESRPVYALDARGFGGSTPFGDEPSIDTLASDLAAFLDYLGIEKAIVGGLSMGGYAALAFARQFGERLAGLVLMDTRPDTDTEEGKKGRNEMMAFARQHDGEAVAIKMLPKLLAETSQQNSYLLARVKELAFPLSGESAAQAIQALRDRFDSTSYLASISVPTLVIGGENDVPAPPAVMGAMAAAIPHAKHVVIPAVGHLSNLEAPEAFNRAVGEFLSQF